MYKNTEYSKILQVSGKDATQFLQRQLSCDITILPTYGAYCNIKGKVECFFLLTQRKGIYELSMPNSMLYITFKDLQKYIIFSKVKLSIITTQTERDTKKEIKQHIPEIYFETKGQFFPHDLNLSKIGAISFIKGCYRGQEIIARMEYRGNLKRTLKSFYSKNINLKPGDHITIDNIGSIVVVRTYIIDSELFGLGVATNFL